MTTAPSSLATGVTPLPLPGGTSLSATGEQGHGFAGLLEHFGQAATGRLSRNTAGGATQTTGLTTSTIIGAPRTEGSTQQSGGPATSQSPSTLGALSSTTESAGGQLATPSFVEASASVAGQQMRADTPQAKAAPNLGHKGIALPTAHDSATAPALPPSASLLPPIPVPEPTLLPSQAVDSQLALRPALTPGQAVLPAALDSSGIGGMVLPELIAPPAATPLNTSFDEAGVGTSELSAKSGTGQVSPGLPTPVSTPVTLAGATNTVAAASPVSSPAPSRQVASVFVQLGHQAGVSQVTMQLNPEELGKVQVQIDRSSDGTAAVHVSAERPETLALIVADQVQLHRALDVAGVPQEGRTLNLSLSTPDHGGGGQSSGGTGQGSANDQAGGQRNGASYGWGAGAEPVTDSGRPASWLRTGVDITA